MLYILLYSHQQDCRIKRWLMSVRPSIYLTWQLQGLWRIEYLNIGRAETEICKQIGGRHDFTYRLFVR